MLTAEYDYNEDIAVKQEDAMNIGYNLGVEQGIEQGIEQGVIESIHKLMKNMNISADEPMGYLDIPKEDREGYLDKL